jgi:RHS repeat-associated protein
MDLFNGIESEYGTAPGADKPLAVSRWGQVYFYAMDQASGSVHGLIQSSTNNTVAQYGYTPFGQLDVGSYDNEGNNIRFKGGYYDGETGLYLFGVRYYDPQEGRFISEDPIGLGGGINLYAFTGDDPINQSDPSGMMLADSHGICTLYAATCGSTEFEEWVASMWSAGSGAGSYTCYVGGDSDRFNACIQGGADYLGTAISIGGTTSFRVLGGTSRLLIRSKYHSRLRNGHFWEMRRRTIL